MSDFQMPAWGYWVMGIGFAAYIALVIAYIVKNRGIKRPVFASPYILWILIFTIVPVLIVAYFSFTNANRQFTLDNFRTFWDKAYLTRQGEAIKDGVSAEALLDRYPRDDSYVYSLIHSIWMAFQCTVYCLLLGYPAAHFMAERNFKLGPTIVVLFMVPMWMNFALRTYAMAELLEDGGIVYTLLKALGIRDPQLLNTNGAVQLGMVYNYLPFMVFPIYNSLNKMDYKLTEAAMDLGCNHWKTFFKVTLPLSIPGVISGITMVFMPAVTTFAISRMMGGSKTTSMFGDWIESAFLGSGKSWYLGSALSMVMMVLILISLGLLRKFDPKGEGGGTV